MLPGKDRLAHSKIFINAFACRKLYEIVGPVPMELYNLKCHNDLVWQLTYSSSVWYEVAKPSYKRFPADVFGLFAFWVMSIFCVVLYTH